MDGYDEIVKLIATMDQYLLEGRMKCEQVPFDDIFEFISGVYNAVGMDSQAAIGNYRMLISKGMERNDVDTVDSVLKLILNESKVLNDLYIEKIKKYDLGDALIPYRTQLQYYKNLNKKYSERFYESANRQKDLFKGKGVVFSAVIGQYDNIRSPEFINDNLDYILFTDSDLIKSDVWNVVVVDNQENLDNTKLARKIKIVGGYEYLDNYDYTIWIDGKLQITGNITDYIENYSIDSPILCFNHYVSDDIYEEAESCIMMGRDDPDIIKAQINRYRIEGYPEHSGLVDSCMLVRDNKNDRLKKTMYDWWNEVKNGSKRDQLSFNYVCWKNQILYDSSPLVSFDNEYVKTFDHGQ